MQPYKFLAILLPAVLVGCRSLPDYEYYPAPDWHPVDPLEQAEQQCIDSLNNKRADVKRENNFQDVMVLLGGGVSAAGGVTAAALSQNANSATPTTVSASIAAGGALIALASKLGSDPGADRTIWDHRRKHYGAGKTALQQFQGVGTPIPDPIRKYAIARFNDCSAPDPSADPPAPPAGVVGAPL